MKTSLNILVAAVALSALFSSTAKAEGYFEYAESSVWPGHRAGYFSNMSIADGHAYALALSTGGLAILNLANPDEPVLVGGIDRSAISAFAVEGNYAFLALGKSLEIFDVTDRANPKSISSAPLTKEGVTAVGIKGQFAFCVSSSCLDVVDISIRTRPRLITQSGVLRTVDPQDMVLTATHAYVGGGQGVEIIDIQNPLKPEFAGQFGNGWVVALALSGNRLFVTMDDDFEQNHRNAFQIFDISSETNPIWLGQKYPNVVYHSISLSGDFAYVCDGGTLTILDVSDPRNIFFVESVQPKWPSPIYDAAGEGDHVYMLGDGYLQVVNVATKGSAQLNGTWAAMNAPSVQDAVVRGNIAYVLDRSAGLQVLDTTEKSKPELMASMEIAGSQLVLGDGIVLSYDRENSSGITAIDVNSPRSPKLLNRWTGNELARTVVHDICVADNRAYVVGKEKDVWFEDPRGFYLWIFELRPQAGLELITTLRLDTEIYSIALSGKTAYLAGNEVFKIMDVTDPRSPEPIAYVPPPNSSFSGPVTVQGNLLFANARVFVTEDDHWTAGVQIFEISDPHNPRPIGSFPGFQNIVHISGSLAFGVGFGGWGPILVRYIYQLDISDPSSPVMIGQREIPGLRRLAAVENQNLFIASDLGLLMIEPFSGPKLNVQRQRTPSPVGDGTSGVEIFWRSSDAGFRLQQSPSLQNPSWRDVEGIPAVVADEFSLSLPTQAGSGFFRLHR